MHIFVFFEMGDYVAHLFEIINPNFFTVLSSPNKRIYVDCIFIIYNAIDSIEESFQGDRDSIVLRLMDYFDDRDNILLETESQAESINTSRQKANHVINTFKKCGWLGEEELGDYKTSINLFDYSIEVIEAMRQMIEGNHTEYTGEIFAIYSLLHAFNLDEGVGILEQAYLKTNDVIRKLKALKANIYRYYYDITKNRKKDGLAALLERLLVDYKQNFFDSAYYNLKTKDSLPRYKRSILKEVASIRDQEAVMDFLANSVMKLKRISVYDDAFNYIEDRLRFITDSFSSLENLILDIDRKNEKYITAAASKILFLTNSSDDIEGIFNRLFKIVLDTKDFEFDQIFNLVQMKNLDTNSLYTPRRMSVQTVPESLVFDDDLITDEYRKTKLHAVLKNNIYSKKEINAHVLNLLGTMNFIEAQHVSLETQEDFIRLILIFLYSKSIGMLYEVEIKNENVTNNHITFRNFVIARKGQSHE